MKKDNIYIIAIIIVILDFFIKTIVKQNMELLENIVIIPNFFNITYVENTGAAFSIFENNKYFLIIISIIILFLILKHIKENKLNQKLEIISFGLILGGLLGNLIDRIVYSRVIDYLSFNIFGYMFPVFNLADIAITIGVFMLIIVLIKQEKKKVDD